MDENVFFFICIKDSVDSHKAQSNITFNYGTKSKNFLY